MLFAGMVVSGKVEFTGPVPLPDGTPVRVEPAAPPVDAASSPLPSLYDQLQHLIGKATGLPEDASVNHDHYLYGIPKQQP